MGPYAYPRSELFARRRRARYTHPRSHFFARRRRAREQGSRPCECAQRTYRGKGASGSALFFFLGVPKERDHAYGVCALCAQHGFLDIQVIATGKNKKPAARRLSLNSFATCVARRGCFVREVSNHSLTIPLSSTRGEESFDFRGPLRDVSAQNLKTLCSYKDVILNPDANALPPSLRRRTFSDI